MGSDLPCLVLKSLASEIKRKIASKMQFILFNLYYENNLKKKMDIFVFF